MTERTTMIAGKPVKLRTSAFLPILYRQIFRQDFLRSLDTLQRISVSRTNAQRHTDGTKAGEIAVADESALFDQLDLVFIAQMEYVMARHADPSIPDTMEEWLMGLDDPNAVYLLMKDALELYARDCQTTTTPKKKHRPRNGR